MPDVLTTEELPKSWNRPLPDPVQHVNVDKHGVLRVGTNRISLDSVVYAFREGESPETIRQNWPLLSLEQVYAAIAFYLANREKVDEYLRRQEAIWAAFRQKCDASPSPVALRLRAIRASRAGQPP